MLNQNYKSKYLKYKTKYLNLQNKLNHISGGTINTAKNSFFRKIFSNWETIYKLFVNDKNLMKKLKEKNIELSPIVLTTLEELKENEILNQVFLIIIDGLQEAIVDDYLKIYLNGKMGEQNSIENKGRYIQGIDDIIKLRKHKDSLKITIPATFDSLKSMESYLVCNNGILECIDNKTQLKTQKHEVNKQIIKEGENDVEIILETPNIIIYRPTTEAGSKCYGHQTKWCTAANKNNMFDEYNKEGPLFIIMSKLNKKDKYQIHFETGQLMDPLDKSVSSIQILKKFNDIELINWYNQKIEKYNKIKNGKLKISTWIPYFTETHNNSIKNLIISINKPLENIISNLTNLEKLTFDSFNLPIGNSLNNLRKLKKLKFGDNFNQPLENSLDNLTNLVKLSFGLHFNQPFNGSLNNLSNLKKLTLKSIYTHSFNESLNNLTNLIELSIRHVVQPIGNSFSNLTKLEKLTFGHVDNPLENSLNKLKNLQELILSGNIKPLGNSLDNLTNLRKLVICANIQLDESLNKLVNLKQLTLGEDVLSWSETSMSDYNKPLGNSLNNLVKLHELTFGVSFDQPLGNSLNTLVNLKKLKFGFGFNNPINDSIKNLVKLEKITLGRYFKHPIDNILDLPKIKSITISKSYNLPIPQKENIEIIKL